MRLNLSKGSFGSAKLQAIDAFWPIPETGDSESCSQFSKNTKNDISFTHLFNPNQIQTEKLSQAKRRPEVQLTHKRSQIDVEQKANR